MALQSNELYGTPVPQTPNLRAYPAENGIAVGQLEQLGADAEVAHLTPLTDNGDGTWGVWADADVSVEGFAWAPDSPVQGLLAGEVHMQIFKAGSIHHDDVPLPAAQTQGTLTTALKASALRQLGVRVQGVAGVQ